MIDCDPGIDDALALALAIGEESFFIEAVTTVSGNVDVCQTTDNLLKILELCGLKEFPDIGKGGLEPLQGKRIDARPVHGKDGLGNTNLNFNLPPDIKIHDAVELIISKIMRERVDAVVATGPLTNLARAIDKEPALARKLKKIYIMGGALRVPGNVTRFAEFNFFCDPSAAKIVLDSKIPITLVSLDITQKAILKREDVAGFKSMKNALSVFLFDIASFSIKYHIEERAAEGAYIHDPLTVGLAIDESLGEFEGLCVDVCVSGEERGRLFIKKGPPNVRFCNSVDYGRFLKLFLGNLERLINSREVRS